MIEDQKLSGNGMCEMSQSSRVSCLNVVAGWELNLDTLEFTLDHSHQSLLSALGEQQPAAEYNLMDYGKRFVFADDIPAMM